MLNLSKYIKTEDSLFMDVLFYFSCASLVAIIFCYAILFFKAHLQNQKINELDTQIASYGSVEQKEYEKKVLDYKKKIDDYGIIINDHKISSNLFDFIEKKTLSQVWFSGFTMSQLTDQINLIGEAKDMETLSQQVQILEKSKDYISDINILTSDIGVGALNTSGPKKVKFVLNIRLNPKIFDFNPPLVISTTPPENSSGATKVVIPLKHGNQ